MRWLFLAVLALAFVAGCGLILGLEDPVPPDDDATIDGAPGTIDARADGAPPPIDAPPTPIDAPPIPIDAAFGDSMLIF